MNIGSKIRKMRELKGFKQESLAEFLNMSQANLSKIENDELDLQFSKLTQIAKFLDVEVEQIVMLDKAPYFNVENNQNSPALYNSTYNERTLIDELLKAKDKTIEILERELGKR
jgi:transcriptional regulator with XRE-family HTH domain